MIHTVKEFAEQRRSLLRRMTKASGGCSVEMVVPFINDDVPRYLKYLKRFEKESRKTNLMVGGG